MSHKKVLNLVKHHGGRTRKHKRNTKANGPMGYRGKLDGVTRAPNNSGGYTGSK